MIIKQNKIYYKVLKRDITRPEHILNRDPLDNNYNRMGLLEKRAQRLKNLSSTGGGGEAPQSPSTAAPFSASSLKRGAPISESDDAKSQQPLSVPANTKTMQSTEGVGRRLQKHLLN
jgi:hypothetical protein